MPGKGPRCGLRKVNWHSVKPLHAKRPKEKLGQRRIMARQAACKLCSKAGSEDSLLVSVASGLAGAL